MHAVLEEHEPGQFVVKLHGELDMATEPVLTDMVQEVLSREGVGKLEVDLSGLQFLDSTGVRALLQIRRATEDRGVTLEVTRPGTRWPRCSRWPRSTACWAYPPPRTARLRPPGPWSGRKSPGTAGLSGELPGSTGPMGMIGRALGSRIAFRPIDRIGRPLQQWLRRRLPDNRIVNWVRGSAIGHPLHPVLVRHRSGPGCHHAVLDAVPGQHAAAPPGADRDHQRHTGGW